MHFLQLTLILSLMLSVSARLLSVREDKGDKCGVSGAECGNDVESSPECCNDLDCIDDGKGELRVCFYFFFVFSLEMH
jgi:hypothetical protein